MVSYSTLRKNPKRFVKIAKESLADSSVVFLYLIPFLLVPATIKAFATGNVLAIVINASGYAFYLFAAQILRRGLQAERIYRDKRVAHAPKFPLKTLAACLVAATTFVISLLGAHNGFFVSIAFGLGSLLGMVLSYGVDPFKQKTVVGDHGYSIEEISSTIEQAEKVILGIEAANNNIRNQEFNRRIDTICETARTILADLEANPGAIRRTRKFLLIYLESTNKVTNGYANTHLHVQNAALEQNFRNVLDSIETEFKLQKAKLLQEDLFDLDVQIEVLAKQLKHQGID